MRAPPGLNLHYVSATEYQSARWSDVLGIASFDGSEAVSPRRAGRAGIPIAQVSTPVLPAAAHFCQRLVQAELEDALGKGGHAVYLQADICRQDLLVEIEAAAMYPCAA